MITITTDANEETGQVALILQDSETNDSVMLVLTDEQLAAFGPFMAKLGYFDPVH